MNIFWHDFWNHCNKALARLLREIDSSDLLGPVRVACNSAMVITGLLADMEDNLSKCMNVMPPSISIAEAINGDLSGELCVFGFEAGYDGGICRFTVNISCGGPTGEGTFATHVEYYGADMPATLSEAFRELGKQFLNNCIGALKESRGDSRVKPDYLFLVLLLNLWAVYRSSKSLAAVHAKLSEYVNRSKN